MLKISVKAKPITLFFCLAVSLCFFIPQKVFGQIEADNIIDDKYSCEEHIAAYDNIFNTANNPPYPEPIIVIIARLGDGESSPKLNQQRLAIAKKSLVFPIDYPAKKIVTAQGDKIKGKGQVEFYVNGRFLTAFKVGRKKNLKGRCE